MPENYPLTRGTQYLRERMRADVVDIHEDGALSYRIVRMSDEIEVYKFHRDEAGTWISGAPDYIIRYGACSCPGFEYRGDCKHVNFIED